MTISILDADGLPQAVATLALAGGAAAIHVLTDGTGTPYSAANPLLTAPAIKAVTPVDRGGTITAANTGQPVMSPNANRKGGWLTADPANTGTLFVSLTGTATTVPGPSNQSILDPGGSCPLTINGYVVQTAVSVAGTVAGDCYAAVEFV